MPPKPKFTRDEIAAIAYQMIKEGGVSSLTARDLGSRMGTSARPIFTLFKNMEEVKQAARALAVQEFMDHIRDFRDFSPAFKRIGMAIVSYGIHEPELFKLLFLQEHPKGVSFEQSLLDMDGMDETCIQLVMQDYGLSRENGHAAVPADVDGLPGHGYHVRHGDVLSDRGGNPAAAVNGIRLHANVPPVRWHSGQKTGNNKIRALQKRSAPCFYSSQKSSSSVLSSAWQMAMHRRMVGL